MRNFRSQTLTRRTTNSTLYFATEIYSHKIFLITLTGKYAFSVQNFLQKSAYFQVHANFKKLHKAVKYNWKNWIDRICRCFWFRSDFLRCKCWQSVGKGWGRNNQLYMRHYFSHHFQPPVGKHFIKRKFPDCATISISKWNFFLQFMP